MSSGRNRGGRGNKGANNVEENLGQRGFNPIDINTPGLELAKLVIHFLNLNPPTFNGQEGPTFVHEWFLKLERAFEILGCTDAQKILCAQYQLEGYASHWWIVHWKFRPATERATLTWDQFKELVMEKYCPKHYRSQLESEFWDLKQGDKSVDEYEREFIHMSFFVEDLVDTDQKMARRFCYGLRADIRHLVVGRGVSYSETVKRAQQVEACVNTGKRKWEEPEIEHRQPNMQDESYIKRSRCTTCGRNHHGVCLYGQNVCYWCKKPGHTVMYCPTKGGRGQSAGESSHLLDESD